MKISEIQIGERHRKNMGNLDELVKSIETVGLLHPIVVTQGGVLVAGERRLAAVKELGWEDVPVNKINTIDELLILAERDENTCRKDLLPSERVSIGRALEPLARTAAKARQEEYSGRPKKTGDKLPPVSKGKTRDKVAEAVGWSAKTHEKAEDVIDAAEKDQELFGDLVEKMDRSDNVDGAHKELKRRRKQQELNEKAKHFKPTDSFDVWQADIQEPDKIFTRIKKGSIDVIMTDPPYPEEYLPLYEDLAKVGAELLKPGGSMLVMVGQSYLPEIFNLMTPHIKYHWTVAYLTPGGKSVQLWKRKVNTFWKPVLWFVKGEYVGDWNGDVVSSDVNANEKELHEWGQTESGMARLIEKFTRPNDLVYDPFVGSGTTGTVAVQLKRRFLGTDKEAGEVTKTEGRLVKASGI